MNEAEETPQSTVMETPERQTAEPECVRVVSTQPIVLDNVVQTDKVSVCSGIPPQKEAVCIAIGALNELDRIAAVCKGYEIEANTLSWTTSTAHRDLLEHSGWMKILASLRTGCGVFACPPTCTFVPSLRSPNGKGVYGLKAIPIKASHDVRVENLAWMRLLTAIVVAIEKKLPFAIWYTNA